MASMLGYLDSVIHPIKWVSAVSVEGGEKNAGLRGNTDGK